MSAHHFGDGHDCKSRLPQDDSWESKQPLRYAYGNGEVVVMTGGTIPHHQVAVNLAALLKSHWCGKGCKVLTSDAKVVVSESGPFHYLMLQ